VSLRLVNRTAAVPALVGALLLPALPAHGSSAEPGGHGRIEPRHFTLVRDAGMPTTSEPSRTVTAADAWTGPGVRGTVDVSVSVTLGAAPSEETATDLRIAIGRPVGATCEVVDTWVVRTDDIAYADPAAPEGTAGLAVTHGVPAGDASGATCVVVTLADPADPDDVTGPGAGDLDRWTGVPDQVSPFRAAPGQARIIDVSRTRLPVREWSSILVRVRIRYHGVTSIRLDGHGRDLRVDPVTVSGDYGKKEEVLLPLQVRLGVDQVRTLRLDTAVAGVAQPRADRVKVRIRPR
jgi:hypothetical protein